MKECIKFEFEHLHNIFTKKCRRVPHTRKDIDRYLLKIDDGEYLIYEAQKDANGKFYYSYVYHDIENKDGTKTTLIYGVSKKDYFKALGITDVDDLYNIYNEEYLYIIEKGLKKLDEYLDDECLFNSDDELKRKAKVKITFY